jgi:hypothetical protein
MSHIVPGRTPRQCRERWENYLAPGARKMSWTAQEDQLVIVSQQKWGNKWAKIAALIPGRTDNAVKNRWNSALRRRVELAARPEGGMVGSDESGIPERSGVLDGSGIPDEPVVTGPNENQVQ